MPIRNAIRSRCLYIPLVYMYHVNSSRSSCVHHVVFIVILSTSDHHRHGKIDRLSCVALRQILLSSHISRFIEWVCAYLSPRLPNWLSTWWITIWLHIRTIDKSTNYDWFLLIVNGQSSGLDQTSNVYKRRKSSFAIFIRTEATLCCNAIHVYHSHTVKRLCENPFESVHHQFEWENSQSVFVNGPWNEWSYCVNLFTQFSSIPEMEWIHWSINFEILEISELIYIVCSSSHCVVSYSFIISLLHKWFEMWFTEIPSFWINLWLRLWSAFGY